MHHKKRLICLLLAAILSVPLGSRTVRAETEPAASFSQAVYVFRFGETADVQAVISSESEQDWVLKTDDGTELARTRASGISKRIDLTFPIPEDFPRRAVLRLFCGDSETVLCEATMFCDQARNEGIRQVATDRRVVALTFDAAGSSGHIDRIFDLLDQYDAKATFFVIGLFAERNPEETAEIVARGHELASHSYEHLDMGTSSADEIFESLDHCDRLLRTFNGDKTVQYRPPSGLSVFADRAIAHAYGADVILWSIDSGDGFSYVSGQDVQFRVLGALHNGGIVLMHVYGRHMLNALNVLLPYYTERGYSFVTVSDLLLDGDTYTDAFGTQRSLHHKETLVAPIAARLKDGR